MWLKLRGSNTGLVDQPEANYCAAFGALEKDQCPAMQMPLMRARKHSAFWKKRFSSTFAQLFLR